MALTTEELAIIDTSKINTQTTLNLMNQVFTYTSNYKDINANSDNDVSISYIDSNGVEQSYTVPTFYKMNTTFQNLMSSMSDGNSYYTKTEVDTKDSAIEAIAQRSGFKNLIINGGFDVWQRGSTLTINSSNLDGYIADRWRCYSSSGNLLNVNITKENGVIYDFNFFKRVNISKSGNTVNNNFSLNYNLEKGADLAGKTITVSMLVRGDSSKYIKLAISRFYGVDSGWDFNITNKVFNIGTEWSKIVFTFNLPEISADKIIDYDLLRLRLEVHLSTGSDTDETGTNNQTGIFDIAQVQMEVGDVATEFEHRPYGLELNLCQRYYEKIDFQALGSDSVNFAGFTRGTNMFWFLLQHTEKRVAPSITITNPNYFWVHMLNADIQSTAVQSIYSSIKNSSIVLNGNFGGFEGQGGLVSWWGGLTQSPIIELDSEF